MAGVVAAMRGRGGIDLVTLGGTELALGFADPTCACAPMLLPGSPRVGAALGVTQA
jgi:hypothetical protein